METSVNSTTQNQVSPVRQPRFSGMSHVSIPCRDLEESKIFYANVMGGELVHSIHGFVEFRIEDIIIGLSEQSEGWTGPDDEYPHYAFYISGPNFELMKNWLDRHGVPNYPYRRDDTALIYFRDPSGNLFELYCDSGYEGLLSLPSAPRRGGQPIDFRALNYHWNSKGVLDVDKTLERPKFTAFAHASIFSRDLEQAKRFFTTVIGGELIHDVDGFAEVKVAGIIIGFTERPGRPTGGTLNIPITLFSSSPKIFCPWSHGFAKTVSQPPSRGRGMASRVFFTFATPREISSRCIVQSSKKRTPSCAAQNRAAATQSTLPV